MPLERLRRILNSRLNVRVDSSIALLARVQNKIDARIADLQADNRAVPPMKPAVRVDLYDGLNWRVRPAKLLHKLGRMTTPRGLGNMSKLSAGWGTRRYFWAIAEGNDDSEEFRLSEDALELDFHQKTLLSDEFGVAMAGLFMEDHYSASETMDISLALRDEVLQDQIQHVASAQPDYLMWNDQPQPRYFLVECKGCQSGRAESANQIRRGLEQLPSIDFTDPVRHAGSFVIATCLSRDCTTLYLVDPPDDEPERPKKREFQGEDVSERTGLQRWRIKDLPAFEKRNRVGKAAQMLQWAGQNEDAVETRMTLEPIPNVVGLRNLPIVQKHIAGGTYQGARLPLFPELSPTLSIFLGVDKEILDTARDAREVPFDLSHRVAARVRTTRAETQFNESTSLDGTCLQIEGI